MATITKIKGNRKEDKVFFHNTISSLKKSMNDFKAESKSEWRLFKTKLNDDMGRVKESLKKMTELYKK